MNKSSRRRKHKKAVDKFISHKKGIDTLGGEHTELSAVLNHFDITQGEFENILQIADVGTIHPTLKRVPARELLKMVCLARDLLDDRGSKKTAQIAISGGLGTPTTHNGESKNGN